MKRSLVENMELLAEIAADLAVQPARLFRVVEEHSADGGIRAIAERECEEIERRAEEVGWTNPQGGWIDSTGHG